MKIYELTREQYDEWCDSPQGLAFNDEITAYIEDRAQSPKGMYETLKYIISMLERGSA